MAHKQERDRIQAEFDSQFRSSHAQIAETKKQLSPAATHPCTLQENHQSGEQPAVVCRSCYDRLQGRVDFMEAVLHIDLKEAARIVYNAVWADPHSGKTYENAAQALLSALKRRAGISLKPFQRFPH